MRSRCYLFVALAVVLIAARPGSVWSQTPGDAVDQTSEAQEVTDATDDTLDDEGLNDGAFNDGASEDSTSIKTDATDAAKYRTGKGDAAAARGNDAKAKHEPPLDPALTLADPRTYRLKIVHRVEAPESAARNVVVLGPIPMNWPEQRIRLLSEKKPSDARTSEQIIKGQAALWKLQVAGIPKGGSVAVERLYEITRYRTHFTLPPAELSVSRATPRDFREQLAGPAPGVETSNSKMIDLAAELRQQVDDKGAWDTVHGFWKWTRDNVKFENGDFRGALYALENRCGDCEEMSALFVGLCRLSGVAARTVWVEGHDYPEFYLVDKQGRGHWIPAQVVGPAWFGEITEYRPIFQKGDRFYDPLQREYVRYVPHTVRADGEAAPKLIVKHDIIADSDINGPAYDSAN